LSRLAKERSLFLKIKDFSFLERLTAIIVVRKKEISSIDFPQHDEVFYFYGRDLTKVIPLFLVQFIKQLL
jgi:hypothetical protein